MGEARQRVLVEARCIREAREQAERDAERRLDAVRFVWFVIGSAVTLALVAVMGLV